MMYEALENMEEAVEVRHDRYMRSHGKKASGGSGMWMFTHKDRGDVDYNNKKEVHTAQGKFSDAKKSAQAWAKENGHHSVYVMEEVEQIDEISKDTLRSYAAKSYNQANTLVKQSLSDQPKSVQKASTAAFKRRSGGIKAAGRRLGSDEMNKIHADVVREEVEELDELKKSTLGSYVKRSADDLTHIQRDITSGGTQAPEYKGLSRMRRNRKAGIANAVNRLTKEEAELDEAVNAKKIVADHDAGHSIDVIVQKHLNKRADNKDEILKVIRDNAWNKRVKK